MNKVGRDTVPDINPNLPIPEFVNPKEKSEWLCVYCHDILREPMQTLCDHKLCAACLAQLSEDSDRPMCPANKPDCMLLSRKEGTVMPDFYTKKYLKQIVVYCLYKDYNCQEIMPWGKLEQHIGVSHNAVTSCSFQCFGCPEIVEMNKYKSHIENCKFRPRPCSCCQKVVADCNMEDHVKSCCSSTVTETEISPAEGLIECPFVNIGCHYIGKATELKAHESESIEKHLQLQLQFSLKIQSEKTQLLQRLEDSETSQIRLSKTVQDLSKENDALKEACRQTNQRIRHISETVAETLEKNHEIDTYATKGDITFQKQEVDKIKTSLKKLHSQVFDVMERRLKRVDLDLLFLETARYDGVLTWGVSNYSERREEAKSGKNVSLHSQPFYTWHDGYKMCGLMYLNGNGNGKDTHLSMYFIIMEGRYDDFLPWPFTGNVTMMLLDQVGTNHVKRTFKPNASKSVMKPQSEMNLGTGYPTFIKLSDLEAPSSPYLKNNAIQFKFIVDTKKITAITR